MNDKKTDLISDTLPGTAPAITTENEAQADQHHRDLTLSHKDAQAGGPDDISIGGEEDPGVGLESLVEENQTEDCTENHQQPDPNEKNKRKI